MAAPKCGHSLQRLGYVVSQPLHFVVQAHAVTSCGRCGALQESCIGQSPYVVYSNTIC